MMIFRNKQVCRGLWLILISLIAPAIAIGQDGNIFGDEGDESAAPWQQDELSQVSGNTDDSLAKLDSEVNRDAEEIQISSATTVRRFHEVLDELLAEFAHDVRSGQINNLKNMAVRRVDVSNALPKTYERYVELLVSERVRENSQVRLVSCIPCKTKTSRLVEGKLLITSPHTNNAELERAANQLGIDNFMDVVLVYHTTHMVLAFQVFDTKTKEMTWARTYNSETVKSRFQRLAVDYSQVAKARDSEEYVPEWRLLIGLGGASVPNIGGTAEDSGMANLMIRSTEKFNNRKTEFGLQLNYYQSTTSFVSEVPVEGESNASSTVEDSDTEVVTPAPEPFTSAIGLYALYAYNFLGSVESYNRIRYGLHAGAGIITATGYLAPSIKFGLDTFFGRRFVATVALNYIASSKVIINDEFVTTNGGVGADAVLSYNF